MRSDQLRWILIIASYYVSERWFCGRKEAFYSSEIVFGWSILNTQNFVQTDSDIISSDCISKKIHLGLWKPSALDKALSTFFEVLLTCLNISPAYSVRISKGFTTCTVYSATDEIVVSKPSTSAVLYKVRLLKQKGFLYIKTYFILDRPYSVS